MNYKLTFKDEVSGMTLIFLNDFMQHVQMPDGSHVSRLTLLPGSEVNWDYGYLVKNDGTVVCAMEANMYVAQYEGCKEHEINIWS